MLRELESWKKEEWRNNRYKLIQVVNSYVFNRDREKKRTEKTWISIVIGAIILLGCIFTIWIMNLNTNSVWFEVLIALIGITPPTTSIAIAIVRNYYSKDRRLEDGKVES